MNEITFFDLLNNTRYLSIEEVFKVKKAYDMAYDLHKNQFRQSGEPYIIHPLNVAYILSEMHVDCDTLCAALLHDTLEDTDITKEELIEEFNSEVAKLVDGVTKISGMNFSSKEEKNMANTSKIIHGFMIDIRIIIIKLADRLHNMRTLQYKSEFKQKENAMETMAIFAPFAYHLGAYRIKNELEDLSLKYYLPDKYKKYEEMQSQIEEVTKDSLEEMLETIKNILDNRNIPSDIKIRTKNIYGIYKKLEEKKYRLSEIHDLLSLKVMVDDISNCYQTLGIVHSKYNPINGMFKDYIFNPKTNLYQSLHTTVCSKDGRLVQAQIRTFDMDKVASFGIATYWDINKDGARDAMQKDVKKFQFYNSLKQIDKVFSDNEEFVNQVKQELFGTNIYVYTPKGEPVELPNGSTVIDFAYHLHTEMGNKLSRVFVNDEEVSPNYTLKNQDRVRIIVDENSYGPKTEWLDQAITTKAKRKIKEFYKSKMK